MAQGTPAFSPRSSRPLRSGRHGTVMEQGFPDLPEPRTAMERTRPESPMFPGTCRTHARRGGYGGRVFYPRTLPVPCPHRRWTPRQPEKGVRSGRPVKLSPFAQAGSMPGWAGSSGRQADGIRRVPQCGHLHVGRPASIIAAQGHRESGGPSPLRTLSRQETTSLRTPVPRRDPAARPHAAEE